MNSAADFLGQLSDEGARLVLFVGNAGMEILHNLGAVPRAGGFGVHLDFDAVPTRAPSPRSGSRPPRNLCRMTSLLPLWRRGTRKMLRAGLSRSVCAGSSL